MPITFNTGVPRSGKSYRSVYRIYKEFICKESTFLQKHFPKFFKKKETEFLFCYTNINQFKFDIDERIIKLDWENLYKKLDVLRLMHIEGIEDDVLVEKAKEFKIYKSFFVVDECANLLRKKEDPVIMFWLSYHGHFYQEIEFIVQHMSMINAEYKKNAEYFYKAIPKQFRLIQKDFKYSQYQTSLMSKTEFIRTIRVPALQNVFDLYVSGSDPQSKNVLLKFLFPIPFLLVYLIYSFLNMSFTDEELQEQKQTVAPGQEQLQVPKDGTSKNNIQVESKNFKNDNSIIDTNIDGEEIEKKLFKLNCFTNFCYIEMNQKKHELPIKFVSNIIKSIDKNNLYYEQKNKRTTFYFIAKSTTFNFLINNQGVKDEKDNNDNTTLSVFN